MSIIAHEGVSPAAPTRSAAFPTGVKDVGSWPNGIKIAIIHCIKGV